MIVDCQVSHSPLLHYKEVLKLSQIILNTRIKNGHIKLQNIPLDDNTEVQVIVIPKLDLSKMSFRNAQRLTKPIKGNLADDIVSERNEK